MNPDWKNDHGERRGDEAARGAQRVQGVCPGGREEWKKNQRSDEAREDDSRAANREQHAEGDAIFKVIRNENDDVAKSEREGRSSDDGGAPEVSTEDDSQRGIQDRRCSAADGDPAQRSGAEVRDVGRIAIRNYLFRIFEKLGISNRVELVLYCLQQRQTSDVAMQAEARPLSTAAGIHLQPTTSSESQLRSSGLRRERTEQTSRSDPASGRSEIR